MTMMRSFLSASTMTGLRFFAITVTLLSSASAFQSCTHNPSRLGCIQEHRPSAFTSNKFYHARPASSLTTRTTGTSNTRRSMMLTEVLSEASTWLSVAAADVPLSSEPIHSAFTIATFMSPNDLYLAFWVVAFASSHIGMSALRDRLIGACGDVLDKVGLINTDFQLPTWWPGDEAGNQLFPTRESAGRQVYRAGYTAVSFTTLGFSAFYYSSAIMALTTHAISLPPLEYDFYFCVAAASSGASIASLFNASPLSLVPGFTATTSKTDSQEASLPLQRNDLLKLSPKGLTRITRHPLIFPVVPWGVATCQLQGSHTADVLLFGGLALYSVLGCVAQDLRVIRQEGSVGTSFSDTSLDSLQDFYQSTSFVPFGAVWDGRQSMSDILQEVPWLGFAGGCVVGVYLEHAILTFLSSLAVV
jgi:uncharacterized membrane protein